VLDMGDGLNSVPKFWGVATLETNFSTLEQFGIFLSAKGTLQINTTQQTKVETITLPGIGPNGSDAARTFHAAAAVVLAVADRPGAPAPAGHDQ